MIKKFFAIAIVIFFIINFNSVVIGNYNESNEIKEWTLMIYGNQDFLMFWNFLTMKGFLKGVKSGENLNVVVIQDRAFLPAKMWAFNENGKLKDRKYIGEVNMGDEETISYFINYCKTNYPAKRYHFDICGHGNAWMGAGWDKTSDHNYIEVSKIKDGIKHAGGVDILTFFTPCNMASLEGFYELRNVTDVIVGSEDLGSFNPNVIPNVCTLLNENFTLSNYEIGKKYVDIVEKSMNETWSAPYEIHTMSAVRTDKLSDLKNSTNDLCNDLIDNMDLYFDTINTAYLDSFKICGKTDFYSFIDTLSKQDLLNETTINYLENVSDIFKQTVINNFRHESRPGANGLTVFFHPHYLYYPSSRLYDDIKKLYGNTKYFKMYGVGENFYYKSNLEFINDTLWDDFLKAFDSNFIRVDNDGSKDYVSIQNAIDNASVNDTIYILNGTYYENIVISKPLTIIGESYESTIIDGNKSGNTISIYSDYVNLCDLCISNSSDDKSGLFVKGNNTAIYHCDICNNYIGMHLKNSNHCRKIVCNNFSDNRKYGVYLESSNINEIYQNFFNNNSIHAFFCNSYANLWDNRYYENPSKQLNVIKGFITIGKINLSVINFDFTHHFWYLDPLRIKIVTKLLFDE